MLATTRQCFRCFPSPSCIEKCSWIVTIRMRLIMLIQGRIARIKIVRPHYEIKLGSGNISRADSRCRQAYHLGRNEIALRYPYRHPLETHAHTHERSAPASTQRYGREAHPAFAVVVRETLPKLHRTKNSMTFPLISASCFLKAYNHSASCSPR